MNNLFFDPKSRYNNIESEEILFLTPTQLQELDIGFPVTETFKPDEFSDKFPVYLNALKEMVKETTIGDINGSEISIPVENSTSKVFICISINGKLCKLQNEEWMITDNLHGLPVHTQIKVFQRLISQGQITLDDLAAEDIDNNVYKQLVANDISGALICREKTEKLNELWEQQKNDKTYSKMRQKVLKEVL